MKTVAGGIAGIVAIHKAPAFAKNMNKLKVGILGLGSHGFAGLWNSDTQPCKNYGVWDDVPEMAAKMKVSFGCKKVFKDPVKLVNEVDVIHYEHADYRKALELVQPALMQGKPVFINRPLAASIYDAEEIIRLARKYDAPVLSPSMLEFGPEVTEMQEFVKENGPIRGYEAYCCEPHFTWHFPHVINYAHAALGGGIDTAYFTGDYFINLANWLSDEGGVMPNSPIGTSLSVLKYKPRNGEPPIIGMNHIGAHPEGYHIDLYTAKANKVFTASNKMGAYFNQVYTDFFVNRKIPRPYDAVLEQHRALVATNVSRLTGRAVSLDSLGGEDALPYSDSIRGWLLRLNKIY